MHIISGCQLVGIHRCPLYLPVLMSVGSPENWKSHCICPPDGHILATVTASDCPFCVIMHEHRQWLIRFFLGWTRNDPPYPASHWLVVVACVGYV